MEQIWVMHFIMFRLRSLTKIKWKRTQENSENASKHKNNPTQFTDVKPLCAKEKKCRHALSFIFLLPTNMIDPTSWFSFFCFLFYLLNHGFYHMGTDSNQGKWFNVGRKPKRFYSQLLLVGLCFWPYYMEITVNALSLSNSMHRIQTVFYWRLQA